MGDWMAYAYPREEDKKNTCVERLDIWFVSNNLFKSTKRVTFRMCTRADIKDILYKAKAVVELFKLYDNFEFAISDEASGCHESEVEE